MQQNHAPLIGVTCSREFEGDAYNYVVREKYFERIRAAGGIPILLTDDRFVPEGLSGILFTGGGDLLMDEAVYGADADPAKLRYVNPWRDEVEKKIFTLSKSVPRVFGICRGMQVVSTFRGGTMHYDIRTRLPEVKQNHSGDDHFVKVEKGSLLYALLKKERVFVNSFHHQAVAKAGEGLAVTAVSEEGVIEALEGENVLLVQWHPERMDDMQPLFDWLCGKEA